MRPGQRELTRARRHNREATTIMSETILNSKDFKRKFEEEILQKQKLIVDAVGLLSKTFDLVSTTLKQHSENLAELQAEHKELREKVKQILQRLITLESKDYS